jgi:hypothetical protein
MILRRKFPNFTGEEIRERVLIGLAIIAIIVGSLFAYGKW